MQQLTPRERQLLDGLLDGKNTKQIAFELGIAFESAKTYLAKLGHKLQSPGRAGIVIWAYESGYRKPGTKPMPEVDEKI